MVVDFRVSNRIWSQVIGNNGPVICINCFDKVADALDIDWTEDPVEFIGVSSASQRRQTRTCKICEKEFIAFQPLSWDNKGYPIHLECDESASPERKNSALEMQKLLSKYDIERQ